MNARDRTAWDASAVQQRVLERDWTLDDLEEAAALHDYLERDSDCRRALAEYDALRAALAAPADHAVPHATAPADGGEPAGDERAAAEPEGGWRAFDARLSAHARSLGRSRSHWLGWTLQLAAAIAVAASAGAAGYFVAGGGGRPDPLVAERRPAAADEAPGVGYLPDDVDEQVGVFGEVSAVFDQQAGWVAFANGRSEMGVASGAVADTPRLLLLRLSLARAGQLVSQTDVVIVPGQRAAFNLPLEDGRTLRYHLHVSDAQPARLGLWAELEQPDGQGETLAALATHLELQSGRVVPAGSMVTESGGYELTLGYREVERHRPGRGL